MLPKDNKTKTNLLFLKFFLGMCQMLWPHPCLSKVELIYFSFQPRRHVRVGFDAMLK